WSGVISKLCLLLLQFMEHKLWDVQLHLHLVLTLIPHSPQLMTATTCTNKSIATTTAHMQSSMQGLGQVLVVIHSSSLALLCYFDYFHKLCIESDAMTRRLAWARSAEVSDGKFLF
ncbi:unnamed protein product, partial [Brassica oleracea var. botrytis]